MPLYKIHSLKVVKLKLSTLLVLIILLGCNKSEVHITNLKGNPCREGSIKEAKIELLGEPVYGEPITIQITSIYTPNFPVAESKAYIQKPNGDIVEGNYKITSFEPSDQGVYYGFFKNDFCTSKKVPLTVTGVKSTPPCNYQNNWFELKGLKSANISKTEYNKNGAEKIKVRIYGSTLNQVEITMDINTPNLQEGRYSLESSPNRLYPASQVGRRAYVEFITNGPPRRYFVNFGEGKLYVEKRGPSSYDFIICDERFSATGVAPFINMKLKATLQE